MSCPWPLECPRRLTRLVAVAAFPFALRSESLKYLFLTFEAAGEDAVGTGSLSEDAAWSLGAATAPVRPSLGLRRGSFILTTEGHLLRAAPLEPGAVAAADALEEDQEEERRLARDGGGFAADQLRDEL